MVALCADHLPTRLVYDLRSPFAPPSAFKLQSTAEPGSWGPLSDTVSTVPSPEAYAKSTTLSSYRCPLLVFFVVSNEFNS
jgi:hypothetical protein